MPAIAIGALDDCRTRDGSHRSRRKRRSCYPRSSIIEKLAAITCLSQVVFGAMLTTLGLAGMPANMEIAGKILSVGLVQMIIGTPGVVGWKLGNDRLWLVYGTIQLVIGVSEICWMAEAILLKTTISAVVLALLAVFQIWSTVITILHLRIDGCTHLSQVARGENHKSGSKSYVVPPSRLSPTISPGLKSPHRKSASKSHSRRDSSKASSMASTSAKHSMPSSASHGKDSHRHEEITLKRYQRASARLNKRVNKQDSTTQSSIRDSEASIAARMKCVPEAKTPPISISEHDSSTKVRKSPNSKKPRRFYFSEYDDVNSLSESDPENSTKQMSSSKQQLGTRHCIYVPRSRGIIALETHTPPSSECSVIPAPPCRPSPIAVTPPLAIQAEPVVPIAPNTQPPPPKVEKKVPSNKPSSNAVGPSIVSTPPHEAPSSSPKKSTP